MGIAVPSQLFGRQHLIQFTMKSVAAALVAVASAAPEAQPWLGYAGLGYGYGGYPYAYATPALAADHFAAKGKRSADAYYGYGGYGGYGKRSADAYYGGDLGGYGKRSADAYYGGYGGYGYGG